MEPRRQVRVSHLLTKLTPIFNIALPERVEKMDKNYWKAHPHIVLNRREELAILVSSLLISDAITQKRFWSLEQYFPESKYIVAVEPWIKTA